jgi:hypothetical protein
MSAAYNHSIRIAGQPCPAGHNAKVWSRYQQIAKDTRLSRISRSVLPDSYTGLYELTKMPTTLLDRIVDLGLVSPNTPYRILKAIRITGKIPLTTTIWTEPGEYDDLVSRIEEVRGEFG